MIKSLVEGHENTFITSDAKVGYFSQEHDMLYFDKTVIENVRSTAVVPEHICRSVLLNLYMSKDDILKKVSVLSGGERVKTALIVSHDRKLVENLADYVYEIENGIIYEKE